MKQIISINLIIFFFFSCASQKKLDNETTSCFKEKMNETAINYSTDFYNSVKDFENVLISNKLLVENDKMGYLYMLNNFDKNVDKYKQIYQSINTLPISNYNTSTTSYKYKMCIYETLKNHKNSKYLNRYLSAYETLEVYSFKDINALKNLVELTDFDSEKMRLIVCSLFHSYIWSTYTT